jgi:hypothetical protein
MTLLVIAAIVLLTLPLSLLLRTALVDGIPFNSVR